MEELKERVDILSRTMLEPGASELTAEEAEVMTKENSVHLYQALRRVVTKVDPIIPGQDIALFSWVPAVGVEPNAVGVYGTARVRGVYRNEEDAYSAARDLVRKTDSANEIFHVRVGQDFPLSKESRFTKDLDEVKIQETMDSISQEKDEAEAQKRRKDRKSLEERERQLLKENDEILKGTYKQDPMETYIMTKVKRAHLRQTKAELEEKLQHTDKVLGLVNEEIKSLDVKDPTFKKEYYQRYLDARKEVGLPTEQAKISLLNYMVEEDDVVELDDEDEKKDYEPDQ